MKFTKNNLFRSVRKAQKVFSGFLLPGIFFSKKSGKNERDHLDLNRELVYSLSTKKLPNSEQLKYLGKFLSKKERIIIQICAIVLVLNILFLGFLFFKKHISTTPLSGGTYIEGLVGSPKYINPLYSSNRDVDADISSLLFSSLFKYDEKGNLVGDAVESWKISDDGREYSIFLKNNILWHNGEKMTADDVVFMVQAIKNPKYRSPLHGSFASLEIEKVSEYEVKFKLSQPYAPFLGLLTFGILPKNIWEAVVPESATLAELNLKPIGSGPYKFKSLTKNKNGEIKEYVLEVNSNYYRQKPYISEISFRFYPDSATAIKALNDNSIDGISYLPFSVRKDLFAKSSLGFHYLNQPQLTAIFFNPKNNEFLADQDVRRALNLAIDREVMIRDIFNNQAREVRGPILSDNFAFNDKLEPVKYSPEEASKILANAGFVKISLTDDDLKNPEREVEGIKVSEFLDKASATNIEPLGDWLVKKATRKNPENKFLIISLTYPDSADNALVAGKVMESWQALGVKTALTPLSSSQIASEVALEKNFESLLFGENVGPDPDVYAFWHSSQISDGLNIASFSNAEVDKLLEEARTINHEADRIEKYQRFQELVTKEQGAIFLLSPNYLYLQVKKLRGFSGNAIIEPSDRFSSVANWYLRVKRDFSW